MAPQTQKALVVKTAHEPYEFRTDWPVPSPGPKDVVVKLVTVALNPADWLIPLHAPPFITYPFVGGIDGAGIVEELGAEVTNVAKGDKVLVMGSFSTTQATFQEYSIIPAESATKIPDNLTFEQAASVPVGLTTVVCGFYNDHGEGNPVDFLASWEMGGSSKFTGKPAVVVGGSGSVGQYAIQAARLTGFSPIITTSSLKHAEYLKSLGATHVLDRSLPADTLLAEIATLTGGEPVAFSYDAIGQEEPQRLAYAALGQGGGFVSVNPWNAEVIADLIKPEDGKRVARPAAGYHLPQFAALGQEVYKKTTGWLADGTFVPNQIQVLSNGMAGILNGLKLMSEFKVSGTKLVVRVQETP